MLLAVWLLGACGRLAFDPIGDAGLDTHGLGSIMVSVRGDTLAAAPVEGAYVFGDPFVSLVRTDAAGLALLPVAGETTVEVMYSFAGSAWRVYSVLAQPPATAVELGGRYLPSSGHSMTIQVATFGTSVSYEVRTPERCGTGAVAPTATITLSFDAACESQTVTVLVLTLDAGNVPRSYEAQVMLASGTTATATGSYVTNASINVSLTNLPVDATMARVDLVHWSADGASYLRHGPSTSAVIVNRAAPVISSGGLEPDAISVVVGSAAGGYSRWLFRDSMPMSGTIDGSGMLPQASFVGLETGVSARWAFTTPATPLDPTTLVVYDATISGNTIVQWTVIADPRFTSAAFPQPPPDVPAIDPRPIASAAFEVSIVDAAGAAIHERDLPGLRVLNGKLPPGGFKIAGAR